MKHIFLLIGVFFVSSSYGELRCSANGTQLLFVNGVLNEEKDVKLSAKSIFYTLEKSKNRIDSNSNIGIKVDFVHNATRGTIDDLDELRYQAARNFDPKNRVLFYQYVLQEEIYNDLRMRNSKNEKLMMLNLEALELIHSKKSDSQLTKEELAAKNNLLTQIKKSIKELSARAEEIIELAEADRIVTDKVKSKIVSAIKENKKVIFVAHSQGNVVLKTATNELFANPSAFENQEDYNKFQNVFGSLHVATPSHRKATYNRSEYITLNKDIVIWGAKKVVMDKKYPPVDPNYEFVSFEKEGIWENIFDFIPGVNVIADEWQSSGFHGMVETYLNPDIGARSIGSVGAGKGMSTIFRDNMIKVAESLEDNCDVPEIKVTSPVLTAGPSADIFGLNVYSPTTSELILVDDSKTYDGSETEFNWTVTAKYRDVLQNKANGSGKKLNINLPYNDFEYELSVIATNTFGKISTRSFKFKVMKDSEPTYSSPIVECLPADSTGFINGNAYAVYRSYDDSYANNLKFSKLLPFSTSNYNVYSPDGYSLLGTVSNTCERNYRYEIWGFCQLGGYAGIDCRLSGEVQDPRCAIQVETGLQYNELRVYKPGSSVEEYSSGLGEGVEGDSGVGYFVDPNNYNRILEFPKSGLCSRNTPYAHETYPWTLIQ